MTEHEININDKIRGIYANLQDINKLLKESEGHVNKRVFNRKIQEHEAENQKLVQELNRQGVTNDEIERRSQEEVSQIRIKWEMNKHGMAAFIN